METQMSLYTLKNGELQYDSSPKVCPETPAIVSQSRMGQTALSFVPCRVNCAKFELLLPAELTDALRKHVPFAVLHCCGRQIELREVVIDSVQKSLVS
jgi:hypothetical protein